MQTAIKKALGYDESPNFIEARALEQRAFQGHSHVYRRARESCGLQGVYLISDPERSSDVPVVFYCKADDELDATRIHQHVWNQGIVPFILVETTKTLRLYSGFRFNPHGANDHARGVLEASVAFNEVASRLSAFQAEAIDNGAVWDRWGESVDPRGRVDWLLLAELEKLGVELRKRGMDREHAHALIGKFVYLKYLRDRGILSDRKLAKWQLKAGDIFSRNATLTAFREVNERLGDWLNGSVYPLTDNTFRQEHLQQVAGVFQGDSATGQLALDLGMYDFSFIPIETLSVIYQQFLHASDDDKPSRGREAGAYYTPIPVVNYMLNEMESRRPLKEGMRVLDPSCGSGAFLVQCYRMLIEKRRKQGTLRPLELRELLTKHIFGVDRDGDACRVAELSLILTLLDYTDPPDLESIPQFKLPVLRDNNIFQADFFDTDSVWARKRSGLKADWLVGNPPWNEAKVSEPDDRYALEWMRLNEKDCPTGGNQVAEAFVWNALPLLNESGVAGLLLPAMTLFKMESTSFRARLFKKVRAWCVTNFANLVYVLFAGRSKVPAMALFFEPRADGKDGPEPDERILTFAPFLANQRAGRVNRTRKGKETWSVVVNGAEVRELPATAAATGDFRSWKVAMWGSFRDDRLLTRIAKRFPSLAQFAEQHDLRIHQGFELRPARGAKETQPMPELAGRLQVDFSKLKECGRIFAFPTSSLSEIPRNMANVRTRGGMKGITVSEPPHIIIDASRRFAVFSDKFVAVPAREIGIHGPESDLLKALSIYLSSDFCRYQQLFMTPQWGVGVSVATLHAFRSIPVPLGRLDNMELCEWTRLHKQLVSESSGGAAPSSASLREVDERVYRLLGLTPVERILVDDFVQWNMQLVQGKVPGDLVAPPSDRAMSSYLGTLKKELDEFVDPGDGFSHDVHVVQSEADASAMIAIRLVHGAAQPPSVTDASAPAASALAKTRQHLLRRHSQWLYFERCLKIYQDGAMYVFKPLEMIHWTRRQAILDAGEIIAETLGSHLE